MEFLSHTLPNGLEIVAERNSDAHSTALGFFVKTGARDEDDTMAGVSHFLEHMIFKGTPTRSADDVNREFDEMGAHYNAFTNEENTVYYAAVLPEYQLNAIRLLADIMRPSLRETDFDIEKKVIVEEIQMYEDQPPFGADEKIRAIRFGTHSLGRSVLGTVKSITDLPVEVMREYFKRRYSPNNLVLISAGNVDFDEMVKTATECCGDWESVETNRVIEPVTKNVVFELIQKESATQQYVLELTDGPSATDAERYAAKLLAIILGDDTGSRLYWELVDPGLAEHAGLGHYEYEGAGVMMTFMSCDPDNAADNVQRILNVYRAAETDGVTEAELSQAKSKVRSRQVLSSERPRGRLFNVGSDWIYRREYVSVKDDIGAIGAVTVDEINATLAKYPLSKATTVTIGPLKSMSTK